MSTLKIEDLLRQTIGLEPAAIGQSALLHSIRRRMEQVGTNDISAYWDLVSTSGEELKELIEEAVVPETWFFRERETFTALCQLVMQEWLPKNRAGILRLLSLPCSTGEEPYSIAMALIDAGFPPERFRVDGVDISERALKVGERAIYGSHSFRSQDLSFRERYFRSTKDGYHLEASVRRPVRFHRGNLLGAGLHLRPASYHFIFCRNALIYLEQAAREQAMNVLGRLLASEGYLFVGHAEAFMVTAYGFHASGSRRTAGFQKGMQSRPASSAAVSRPSFRAFPAPGKPRSTGNPKLRDCYTDASAAEPQTKAESRNDLQTAAGLADAGHLTEAAEICEKDLQANGPSAAVYYLLGLVHDAQGNREQAAGYYRKTIYLDSGHVDALMHLALLAETEGDFGSAQRLRERARRVENTAKR